MTRFQSSPRLLLQEAYTVSEPAAARCAGPALIRDRAVTLSLLKGPLLQAGIALLDL